MIKKCSICTKVLDLDETIIKMDKGPICNNCYNIIK
jgi:hypothetical protein